MPIYIDYETPAPAAAGQGVVAAQGVREREQEMDLRAREQERRLARDAEDRRQFDEALDVRMRGLEQREQEFEYGRGVADREQAAMEQYVIAQRLAMGEDVPGVPPELVEFYRGLPPKFLASIAEDLTVQRRASEFTELMESLGVYSAAPAQTPDGGQAGPAPVLTEEEAAEVADRVARGSMTTREAAGIIADRRREQERESLALMSKQRATARIAELQSMHSMAIAEMQGDPYNTTVDQLADIQAQITDPKIYVRRGADGRPIYRKYDALAAAYEIALRADLQEGILLDKGEYDDPVTQELEAIGQMDPETLMARFGSVEGFEEQFGLKGKGKGEGQAPSSLWSSKAFGEPPVSYEVSRAQGPTLDKLSDDEYAQAEAQFFSWLSSNREKLEGVTDRSSLDRQIGAVAQRYFGEGVTPEEVAEVLRNIGGR